MSKEELPSYWIRLRRLAEIYQRFGEYISSTFRAQRFHLWFSILTVQGKRLPEIVVSFNKSTYLLLGCRQYIPLKYWHTSTRQSNVEFQNTAKFIARYKSNI
jgi:hypothetical protein